MARIVDYMRKRHLNVQHWGLSLNEILDEMQAIFLKKLIRFESIIFRFMI
jgi:hypothetical protein